MPRSFDSVFYGAAGTSTGDPVDDEFNRVSFLSHFDGANNGVNNAFDDGSASNHTITVDGSVTQGSFGPFARPEGEWGVAFDGAGDYLSAANSSDWALANGEFTIEAWVFIKPSGTVKQAIVGHWTNGSRGWQTRTEPSGSGYKLKWTWTTDGGNDISYTGSIVADFNTWNHVAWVRASNTITLYVNGVAGGTVSGADIFTPNTPLVIGDWDSNAADLNGVISNLRLVKGTAVYTGNFTPSTSPLTAVTNTKLLTCQSNSFVDNSASAHTITQAGNASVSAFGPFLTSEVYDPAVNGASGYFDGADSDLVVADNSDVVATGDYTLDVWLYPTNNVARTHNPSIYRSGTTQLYMVPSGNPLRWYADGVDIQSSSLDLNSWNHVAAVRSGTGSNNVSLYVNGVRKAQGTNTGTMGSSSNNRIGSYSGTTGEYDGYMCDMRLLVGTALYSGATYTVPTAPLTAITNTKLLLNMADGQVIDSAAQKEWTATTVYDGTPKLQTAQKKMGTSSLYFDGSSGYYFPSGFVPDGTGDFTVEFWFRASNLADNTTMLVVGDSTFYQFYQSNLYYWNGASSRIISGTISTDTWYHVAGVRSGTTIYLFLNGTSQGTTLTGITGSVPAGAGYMGGNQGGYKYTGYIDEMRISRFARYTSNFTPATEPFPDKGQ